MILRRRAYEALLRFLPSAFRREYGEEMLRALDEHWEDVRGRASAMGRGRFWARQYAAVLKIGIRLRLRGASKGRTGRGEAGMMDGFGQELRQALRSLIKRPGFAAITVLTLGLGIGGSTAIFSAVHAVLLRPLPFQDAERVLSVVQFDTDTGERDDGLSAANARDLAERSRLLDAVAIADPYSMDLMVEGRAESLRAWQVAAGFFDALGVSPMLGRSFTDDEYVQGAASVVLLGHGSWVNRFGADPSIVGEPLTLDGGPVTVVGVLPPTFKFPDAAELWLPRPPQEYDQGGSRAAAYMAGVARLAEGATLEQARSEVERIAASLAEAYPDTNADVGFELVPIREHLLGDVSGPLAVLFAAVGFVLLIACANVAGLMLARGAQRQREYALRGALGASRARLVRIIGSEAAVLAVLGCAAGVALAFGGVRVIQSLGPDHLPRIDELTIDGTVLAFAVLIAAASAVISGLVPALRLAGTDVRETLGDGARGVSGGTRGNRLRGNLVVAEVALAVVLLIGAGLLLRSFAALLDEDLGFDPENRLAVQVFAYGYEEGGRADFVNRTIETIEALPGAEDVAITSNLPTANDGILASIDIDVPFTIVDRAAPPRGQEPVGSVVMVSHSYFDVMGIPVVAGRSFDRSDNADAQRVVMVSETLAHRHFGERSPLGEQIDVRFASGGPREIVGVVKDVRPTGHESSPRSEIYFPLTQVGTGSLTFVVRTSTDAAGLTNGVLQSIWDVNPSQSIWGAATLEGLLAERLKERRFNLYLITGFAVIALVLAAVGVYGLISFSVEQRVGEIGIRRALGGPQASLLAMVLGEGTRLAVVGIVLGVLGATLLTRFLETMLFGVEATDPVTFAGLAALVLVVAALAALLPALRATRIDPVVALRSE